MCEVESRGEKRREKCGEQSRADEEEEVRERGQAVEEEDAVDFAT